MENSTTRKVKVTVRDKYSLQLLMEKLETEGEVEVILEMEDTKQNYSTLTHSPEILDWDFITAGKPRQDKEEKAIHEKVFNALLSKEEGILKGIEPGNWNQVAWRIENVWRAALKSPAVLFQSDFFWKVIDQVSQYSPTPEHAILVKLSEARWSDWEWENVDQDLTEILNSEWKELGKKSLVELSRTIYGKS